MAYDQTEPCDNCGHEGAKTQRFDCDSERPGARIPRNFCAVCAKTHLSKATNYPRQCGDPYLYKALGWITNEILSRLPEKPHAN